MVPLPSSLTRACSKPRKKLFYTAYIIYIRFRQFLGGTFLFLGVHVIIQLTCQIIALFVHLSSHYFIILLGKGKDVGKAPRILV